MFELWLGIEMANELRLAFISIPYIKITMVSYLKFYSWSATRMQKESSHQVLNLMTLYNTIKIIQHIKKNEDTPSTREDNL